MAIIKGAINPVIAGTTTFPELDNIQVTAPNRHSVRPSLVLDFANSKTLDPRITFTRGSNATYYDGSTALAEQNLLKYSQDFTNLWTITSGNSFSPTLVTAPDGTTTATGMVEDSATSWHEANPASTQWNVGSAVIGVTYTFSIFLKAGTRTACCLYIADGADKHANFSLTSTGSVTATNGVTASIYLVGNGWYRCSITRTAETNYMRPTIQGNVFGTYAGTAAAVPLYIWGAQMEQRSAVSAYTPTTTTPISNYIPVLKTAGANQPRFDVDPITQESKGLLIEEQRTNSLLYSHQLDQWSLYQTGGGTTPVVTANSVIAPDGTLTADAVTYYAPVSGDQSSLYSNFTSTTTGSWSGSVWIKALTSLDVGKTIGFRHVGGGTYTIVTLTNSWVRVSNTETRITTPSAFEIVLRPAVGTSSGTVRVALWGAQIEAGAFATSYISTSGATATRAADAVSMIGNNFSSWYRNDAGTFYASASLIGRRTSGFESIITISSPNAAANEYGLGTEVVGNTARVYVLNNSSLVADLRSGSPQLNTEIKIGFGYKTDDFAMVCNGGNPQIDTNGNIPFAGNLLTFGIEPNGGSPFNGYIKKLAYYPVRLSNAELQGLTAP